MDPKLWLYIKNSKQYFNPPSCHHWTSFGDQYITENPLNNIIVSKLLDKKTKKSDYKPDPFDTREINAILNTAEDQLSNLFQFAFFSDLRISELIGLR